jgi:very-short-patch-repair endonuclease
MGAQPLQYELALCGGFTAAPRGLDPRRCSGIRRCESPLETMLATAFSRLPGFQWRLPFVDEVEVGRWPKAGIILLAQAPCGPYWTDFSLREWSDKRPPIFIEVDGHDFHERTPFQAQRDRRRDRYLTKLGATAPRFTGREVWQDARRCAWEVWGFTGRKLNYERFCHRAG